MTSRDFCYWLQGHFEIANPASLSESQTEMVKRHLALVFKHEIDPSTAKPGTPEAAALDEIHGGAPFPPPKIGGNGPGGVTYRC